MKRLTSDKPVAEMRMFELAYNSCYIKDGKVRYRDYSLDEDARLLARRLLKDHADGDDAFTSDEDFDDWMVDYLQDGMDSTEGLIALFYRNLCAMADLREALKAYEDTGLSSEQIVEMDNLYAEKCREVAELKEYKELEAEMSGDLISRSALMQSLRNNVLIDVTPNLERAIDEQPTAYDVDKVVEDLKDSAIAHTIVGQEFEAAEFIISAAEERAISRGLNVAIEIVKRTRDNMDKTKNRDLEGHNEERSTINKTDK